MPKYLKIVIAALFVLAAALGLYQRSEPLFGDNRQSYIKQQPASGDQSADYFYNTGQSIQQTKPKENTVTFLAGGDIMLSRDVAGAIAKAKDPLLPFKGIEPLLRSTDFNFANLESPFSGQDGLGQNEFVFNAPKANVEGLETYNFKILNLANNHAFDQGVVGVNFTYQWLDQHNIQHVGTGTNLDGAWQPQIIEASGVKIGFIGASYSSANDGGRAKNNYVARIEDTNRLAAAITDLKSRSDFIVVTMHAGVEYTRNPNQEQIDFAHTAIDDGADIVIGAHPHWVQTTETYKGKHIFYSLGNLIFDQEWSRETKEGLTLKITLDKQPTSPLQGTKLGAQLKQIELIPVIVEKYCCPRIADDAEKQNILKKIGITNPIMQ